MLLWHNSYLFWYMSCFKDRAWSPFLSSNNALQRTRILERGYSCKGQNYLTHRLFLFPVDFLFLVPSMVNTQHVIYCNLKNVCSTEINEHIIEENVCMTVYGFCKLCYIKLDVDGSISISSWNMSLTDEDLPKHEESNKVYWLGRRVNLLFSKNLQD